MFWNKKIAYAAAIGLVLVVVFVPLPSLTRRGKGAVRGAMAPAERGASSLWRRLSEASAAIRGIGGAVEKSRELSYELARAQAELDSLRGVEAENLRLRRALGLNKASPHELIPCDVVSRDISGWWNTVRLGKGARAGVRANRAVVSPDGLVGRTNEVTPFTTEVLLLSDPACRVAAKLARTNVYGLVRGAGTTLKGHPKARMEFINKDVEINVGDEVVTSGLSSAGGEFPSGAHIGYVEKVYRDDSGLFQYAELIPRAAAGLLDYVFVVADARKEAAE